MLEDSFGRKHTYLRISLTERCNLRCNYCMPADGIPLSPKSHLMNADEIYSIASTFVKAGVTKIRLTGGEPLVRKDARDILKKLASLPVELAISTNAVTTDRHIEDFKKLGIQNINISLDTLIPERFKQITRRDYFEKVYSNIFQLLEHGFNVKINCVLMKGVNDDEIIDFIKLSEKHLLHIRFIEFMPFDGNRWNMSKLVSQQAILNCVENVFEREAIKRIADRPNDTSRNYQIKGYKGTFAIISTVTNPFCDSCNRIRLTANGQIKNCLFSANETDLLSTLRGGESITPLIEKAIQGKFKSRGGMDTLEKFKDPAQHGQNRSMIAIGG
ncbi:GTP 3',8-cyclase MoaA [Marivirga harenae]|uniref:GTP 3',8-cyclase MoaA n=1 Tax=Marivirga harenae TaxID=2010992 RepID=UPI0026DF611D|nr:GTP 3',8-cyclase MoaA [Marivirga harenae]WKV12442.1 GTP 3',8-cyclase MoaA [Marivirga harenae]